MYGCHLRRTGFALLFVLLLVAEFASPAAAAAAQQAAPVRLAAQLSCLPGGGAEVAFTVSNVGNRTLTIRDDFHLTLSVVRGRGLVFGGVVFVFPVPDFAVILPGESSTFRVPIGDAIGGEGGTDLSGRRLVLEAEVWFEGRDRPVRRYFSFPGCNA